MKNVKLTQLFTVGLFMLDVDVLDKSDIYLAGNNDIRSGIWEVKGTDMVITLSVSPRINGNKAEYLEAKIVDVGDEIFTRRFCGSNKIIRDILKEIKDAINERKEYHSNQ